MVLKRRVDLTNNSLYINGMTYNIIDLINGVVIAIVSNVLGITEFGDMLKYSDTITNTFYSVVGIVIVGSVIYFSTKVFKKYRVF